MKEKEVVKLSKEIYRLSDFLQECKDKELVKKYPLLYENASSLFENECDRLENWLKDIKDGKQC